MISQYEDMPIGRDNSKLVESDNCLKRESWLEHKAWAYLRAYK